MIGRERRFHVGARNVPSKDRDHGEWLHDATWLHYDETFWPNVPPVAETERGAWKQIGEDLQSLPVARADVRLMVFASRQPGIDATFERVVDQLLRFRRSLI